MSNVILSIAGTSVQPQRLEGNVTSKDGFVTIEYKEKGMVKTKTQKFAADDLAAYMTGEAGFVVAMLNEPVAKAVGTLATLKSGATAVKTEAGTVVVNNKVAGVLVKFEEVDADSKEARAAERASKVKVRGARATAAKSERSSAKKPSREERRAAKKSASGKAEKSGAGDKTAKKKKTR